MLHITKFYLEGENRMITIIVTLILMNMNYSCISDTIRNEESNKEKCLFLMHNIIDKISSNRKER